MDRLVSLDTTRQQSWREALSSCGGNASLWAAGGLVWCESVLCLAHSSAHDESFGAQRIQAKGSILLLSW